MPDIAVSADNLRLTHPQNSERFDALAGEVILAGQPVYLAATGKFMVADANVAGKQQARGVALRSAGPGRPGFTYLKRGPVAGYDIAAMAYDAPVFLSDTAGAVGTTAGTMSVTVGRVMQIPDGPTPTKVIYFDFPVITTFA